MKLDQFRRYIILGCAASEHQTKIEINNNNYKVTTNNTITRIPAISVIQLTNQEVPLKTTKSAIMKECSVRNQYFATLCMNIISLAYGTTVGWLSPFLPILQSEDSPLATGPVTMNEASWIGSLLCVGAFFGSFLFGWMSDRYGRKITGCAISLPILGFWVVILFGKYVEYLYLARLLTGLGGGGIFSLIPTYVSEISEDRVRGSLGSIMIFAINFGILLAFTAGTYLSYLVVASIMLFLPIVYIICFSFLPETPQFRIKQNRQADAELSLRYFRGILHSETHSDEIQQELEKMIKSTITNTDKPSDPKENSISLADLKSPAIRKSMIYGIILIALNMLCGCFVLINYTATIFAESGSTLPPNISAIIVGIIQVIGSVVSTAIIDRAGRKVIYSTTTLCTALGFAILGLHNYFKHIGWDVSAFDWVPVFCLSFVIFIASVGLLPLTFVVLSEMMPQKIRSYGTSFCTAFMWICAFIVIKYFAALVDILGMYGCMWIFSGVCFSGTLFILVFIPETKGRSLDSIMQMLEK